MSPDAPTPTWCMLTCAQSEVKPQDKNLLPLVNQPAGLHQNVDKYCMISYQMCQAGFPAMYSWMHVLILH